MSSTIDVSLVERLVAAQFPQWADLPIRPIERGGWDDRTFHLGEHMTVRLPSAAAYAPQVEKEHEWLPRKLARLLPLSIPIPLAMGEPVDGYPWCWSVYQWLDGDPAATGHITDLNEFATKLAEFLAALQRIDASGGPPPGPHNFYRGGSLTIYDAETRQAISVLDGRIDTDAVTAVWDAALGATWHGSPVWLHGDVAAENLLVDGGRLSAVIDFGSSGVGDPACDLSIAWTFFGGESQEYVVQLSARRAHVGARPRLDFVEGPHRACRSAGHQPSRGRKISTDRSIEILADHKAAA